LLLQPGCLRPGWADSVFNLAFFGLALSCHDPDALYPYVTAVDNLKTILALTYDHLDALGARAPSALPAALSEKLDESLIDKSARLEGGSEHL
jgi:hypothetical protein